jgi:7,8-dihydro-6-hydroxymethylpterin-pyrophosphokinase
MIDLDFFAWREPARVDTEDRLLIPHRDPMEYDSPVNLLFETAQEAFDYAETFHPAEYQDWKLVHYVGFVQSPETYVRRRSRF